MLENLSNFNIDPFTLSKSDWVEHVSGELVGEYSQPYPHYAQFEHRYKNVGYCCSYDCYTYDRWDECVFHISCRSQTSSVDDLWDL